ncbi:hypothetical protein EPN52_07650 [bacterium]|nr:MAG: hypothetical protein EPN52_07650 [bacterium]
MLAALVLALAAATPSPVVIHEAAARSAGNRRAEATAIAQALLARPRLASITKVRVDGAAGIAPVAGILLSGTKLHAGAPRWPALLAEVSRLAALAFATDPHVAEVDIWATVPLNLRVGTRFVSGDLAQPDSAVVFTRTQRRGGSATMWWDPAWRAKAFDARAP